jgi:hypothetical protein
MVNQRGDNQQKASDCLPEDYIWRGRGLSCSASTQSICGVNFLAMEPWIQMARPVLHAGASLYLLSRSKPVLRAAASTMTSVLIRWIPYNFLIIGLFTALDFNPKALLLQEQNTSSDLLSALTSLPVRKQKFRANGAILLIHPLETNISVWCSKFTF